MASDFDFRIMGLIPVTETLILGYSSNFNCSKSKVLCTNFQINAVFFSNGTYPSCRKGPSLTVVLKFQHKLMNFAKTKLENDSAFATMLRKIMIENTSNTWVCV